MSCAVSLFNQSYLLSKTSIDVGINLRDPTRRMNGDDRGVLVPQLSESSHTGDSNGVKAQQEEALSTSKFTSVRWLEIIGQQIRLRIISEQGQASGEDMSHEKYALSIQSLESIESTLTP